MDLVYGRMKEDFPNLDDDMRKNKKLYLKLKKAVIIAKEKLSAVGSSTVSVTVDNVSNDDDYEGVLDIKEINEIVEESILPTLNNDLKLLFEGIKIQSNEKNPIDIVLLGGSNRIPRIQDFYKSLNKQDYGYFNKNLNQTVNMDENISCGCCYYSLIMKSIWNVDFESDIDKYKAIALDIMSYDYNRYSVEESTHFKNIDPNIFKDDEEKYFQELIMNHKWLVNRNKATQETDMKRNDFETEWYIIYIYY